jgi:four helix bundle protein
MSNFKTLQTWKKADDLVVKIYDKSKDFPRYELYGLTSQLRRASVSVCANIAEGSGRGSLGDYIRFLLIAKGSLSEVEYLLHLAHRLGYLSSQEYDDFASLQSETAKMLTGFIKAKQRQQRQEPK